MDRELAVDIELFSRGGQEILNAIERQGYAVLGHRPAISKTRKLALVARAALGKLLGSRTGESDMSAAVQPMPSPFSPTLVANRGRLFRCRSITRTAAKNFYYAFLVLPRRQAPGAVRGVCLHAALRRHCRRHQAPAYERRQRLEAWLDAFHRAEAGHPTDDPVLLALTDTQRRFKIPVELLDQLAYGTGMDIQEDARDSVSPADDGLQVLYQTFEDLRLYCYRVASVVGLVCIRIFGYRDPAAEALAEHLGLAFQLTNIIRDIKEDAAMGRIYLPAEDLDTLQDCARRISPGGDSGAPALAAGGRSRPRPRILRLRRRT